MQDALRVCPEHPPQDLRAWLSTVATRRLIDVRRSDAARGDREDTRCTNSLCLTQPTTETGDATPSSCSSAAAIPISRPPPTVGKIMKPVDTSESSQHAVASLRSTPTGPVPDPPLETRAQLLPIDQLHWDDVERLYLRLLEAVESCQFVKLFGVPGQSQGGIDVYARLPLDVVRPDAIGRHYITLQSRRVRNLAGDGIKKAVDAFLQGEWGAKTARFYFATSYDLQEAKLDRAVREQTEGLQRFKLSSFHGGSKKYRDY